MSRESEIRAKNSWKSQRTFSCTMISEEKPKICQFYHEHNVMEIWILSELKFMEKSEPLPKFCSLPYDQRNFGEKILDVPTKAHGQYFMLPSLPDNVYQKWQTSIFSKSGCQYQNFYML